MELDISNSKESMADCIIRHFQTEMEKFNDIMEVQVCVPMRLKGELSCYNLNTKSKVFIIQNSMMVMRLKFS